jgi:hypothetical protein
VGSVQAKHIQRALGPRFRGDQSAQEVSELLSEAAAAGGYDPMSRMSPVLAGDRPVGWIGLDMLDAGSDAATVAETISADGILSADLKPLPGGRQRDARRARETAGIAVVNESDRNREEGSSLATAGLRWALQAGGQASARVAGAQALDRWHFGLHTDCNPEAAYQFGRPYRTFASVP